MTRTVHTKRLSPLDKPTLMGTLGGLVVAFVFVLAAIWSGSPDVPITSLDFLSCFPTHYLRFLGTRRGRTSF